MARYSAKGRSTFLREPPQKRGTHASHGRISPALASAAAVVAAAALPFGADAAGAVISGAF